MWFFKLKIHMWYKNNINLEIIGIGQSNNVVSVIKFCQNTWRIPLVYHVITNRMMMHAILN